jgi:hypothetical protein
VLGNTGQKENTEADANEKPKIIFNKHGKYH